MLWCWCLSGSYEWSGSYVWWSRFSERTELKWMSQQPVCESQIPSSFQQSDFQQQNVQNSSCCGMPGEVSSFSRFPPGGLTPQAVSIRQIADLVETLDGNQTRVLRDMLNERVGNQERMIPEFLGDIARSGGVPFVADESGETLIGDSTQNRSQPLDGCVFKIRKPAPVPPVSDWKNREGEILGWGDYVSQLVAWAAQASEVFAQDGLLRFNGIPSANHRKVEPQDCLRFWKLRFRVILAPTCWNQSLVRGCHCRILVWAWVACKQVKQTQMDMNLWDSWRLSSVWDRSLSFDSQS